MTPDPAPLAPWFPDTAIAPPPDPDLVPDGFVVEGDDGTRLHFLDWGGPADADPVLLVPGLLQPAWTWAPVARRLAGSRRVVVPDLRGHGLSDAPPGGYEVDSLAADLLAVAEGSGLLDRGRTVVLAGLGHGGAVAGALGVRLGERCARLVLVDGGWERAEVVTGLDVEEFLRGLDEPPEVLRSMAAYVADRRAFDPATWGEDQERAARDAVVETAAGRLVRAVRPHVVAAMVRAMFGWDPAAVLPGVRAPIVALVALGAGERGADAVRLDELRRTGLSITTAGRAPVQVAGFQGIGHNLPRYRSADVAAAILAPAD